MKLLLSIHIVSLFFFSIFRLVEYVALHALIGNTTASHLMAFVNGLWFDNVISCSIAIVPAVVLLLPLCFNWCPKWLLRGVSCWYALLFALALMPSAANTPYFHYFFKNINSSIFEWFGYTETTFGMLVQETSYWPYITLYFVLTAAFLWILHRLRVHYEPAVCKSRGEVQSAAAVAFRLVLAVVAIAACAFGIRGRTGYNPIKVSQAYYCDDSFLNQLGINPMFNLIASTLDDFRKENKPLTLMPVEQAIVNVRASLGVTGKMDKNAILRRKVVNAPSAPKRLPNVVFIIMESMSANLMQSFGQPARLTPTLDSIYHHSLAFTRYYSAGIHTNQGLTATFYSFPAIMFRNLMKGTVTPHYSGIPTVLKQYGYHNLFFMTHEAQYDNMKAFLVTNGYDDIYSQECYPRHEVVTRFGIADHDEFNHAIEAINRQAKSGKPFMATILTISNHPPYIIPKDFHPRSKEKEQQVVEYADWSIGDFLGRARAESWYKNTLFVIQADHGRREGKCEGELPESYNHIPLMIFGPHVPTMRYDGLGMQVDLMPTLLGLLKLNYQFDGFGVDLLRHRRNMVFYSADNQIVARDDKRCYLYSPPLQRSFCYDVMPNGRLVGNRDEASFSDLRQYVFSMIQTADHIQRQK